MQPQLLPIIAAASTSISLLLIVMGVFSRRGSARLAARLEDVTAAPPSVEEYELSLPFSERFLLPILRAVGGLISRRTPQERMNAMRRKLVLAGNPGNWTVPEFMALRLVAAVVMGPMGAGAMFLAGQPTTYVLGAGVGLAALGYYYPIAYLSRKIKERKNAIQKALPDSIDLLTISVEAGLGFDLALRRVTDKWQNPLSEELNKVLNDIRIGRARREALRDMVERTDVDDLSQFVSAVLQAEQLGTGMVTVLRIQAEQSRTRRRQRAEEKAHQAPIKIMIPTVFLIFPAIYVVVLGPAIPRFMEAFGGL